MGRVRHFVSIVFFFLSNAGQLGTLKKYAKSNFSSPPPEYVKQNYLKKQQSPVWIETGTFQGKTTEVLASVSSHVTTIEAQEIYYLNNIDKFSKISNVTALYGESTQLLGGAIQHYVDSGFSSMSFFLDAHFSGGETFGIAQDSPILRELEIIETFLPKLSDVSVFIDDFRLFNNQINSNENYPSRDYLMKFATRNALSWDVSHDMFILSKVLKID